MERITKFKEIMTDFIIEIFSKEEGELLQDEVVSASQRLLNETDLDVICKNHDGEMAFVRRSTDTVSGYFVDDDNRWDYGSREQALNVIKRRI